MSGTIDRTAGAPAARPRQLPPAPARFERPGLLRFAAYVTAVVFFVWSIDGAKLSPVAFWQGVPDMADFVAQMFPPDISRIGPVLLALLETFQMALVGTVFGVLLAVPLAILATRQHAPNRIVYHLARGLVSLFRTVPDLIWALFFVVTVGLGPFAGTLALMIDTMGFCGRFFAEAMEEADEGPQEALTAMGASPGDIVFAAVLPSALPSMINASLFSLEKATRSSVVLGLVGAGGIGIELKVAIDLFDYAQAATIMLCIFALVIAVERFSATLRQRII
jgi:phosphonate transport system permease protein